MNWLKKWLEIIEIKTSLYLWFEGEKRAMKNASR